MSVNVGVTVSSMGRRNVDMVASEFSVDAHKMASAAANKSIITIRGG